MIDTSTPSERAYLVGLEMPGRTFDGDDSLEELASLVAAAGGQVVGRMVQRRRTPDANPWPREGNAGEVGREGSPVRGEGGIFDRELWPRPPSTSRKGADHPPIQPPAVGP